MPFPQLILPTVARLPVTLRGGPVVHPTSGYRRWAGQFESTEPIVALVVNVSGDHFTWARTSNRGTQSLETSILFSPFDEDGSNISVGFNILDAGTVSQTRVESIQTQPAPLLQAFSTGALVHIASVTSEPLCELKALFLARNDVASVRNGVWHARGDVVASLSEPWRTVLTYGRTGRVMTSDGK